MAVLASPQQASAHAESRFAGVTAAQSGPAVNRMFLLSSEKFPAELLALVKHRNLGPGETLYHRGDRALAVFAVEKGRLHLLSHSSNGKPW